MCFLKNQSALFCAFLLTIFAPVAGATLCSSQVESTPAEVLEAFIKKSTPDYRAALVRSIVSDRNYYEAPFGMIRDENKLGFEVETDYKTYTSTLMLKGAKATDTNVIDFLRLVLTTQERLEVLRFYVQDVPAEAHELFAGTDVDRDYLEGFFYDLPGFRRKGNLEDAKRAFKTFANTYSKEDFTVRWRVESALLEKHLIVAWKGSVDEFRKLTGQLRDIGLNLNAAAANGGPYSHVMQLVVSDAAGDNRVERVKIMLQAGVDPNLITNESWLLFQAMEQYANSKSSRDMLKDHDENREIIELLLAHPRLDLAVNDEDGHLAYLNQSRRLDLPDIKMRITQKMKERGLTSR